jgi:hypothetical protein
MCYVFHAVVVTFYAHHFEVKLIQQRQKIKSFIPNLQASLSSDHIHPPTQPSRMIKILPI